MFLEQRLANPKQANSFERLFWISSVQHGGGSPPSPPPAPNYAQANRAGVIADAQTLGARKQIENAAKYGGKALQFGVVTETNSDGTITYRQLYDENGKRLRSPRIISEQEALINFDGMSDIDGAKKVAEFQREEGKATAQYLLDLQDEFGVKYAQQAREQLRAVDPSGFDLREQLASESLGASFERIGESPEFRDISDGPQMELQEGGPRFAMQNYGPQFALGSEYEGGGAAAVGRGEVERQLGEQLFNQGRLTPEEERRLNNAVRGGQVARGNAYGNAPLAQEILARFGAETDRARQARSDVVGYLSSGQSSFDVARAIRQEANQLAQQGYINYSTALGVNNQLAQREYENESGAMGQRNTARQQEFANQNLSIQYGNQMAQQGYQNLLNNITQRNQATQQRLANMQTFAGLQPIVTQGGQLQGLQQQAAPFMQTPIPQGVNINPNAGQMGTQFALGVYDNQTRQYQSQMQYAASQPTPLSYITGIGGLIFGR